VQLILMSKLNQINLMISFFDLASIPFHYAIIDGNQHL